MGIPVLHADSHRFPRTLLIWNIINWISEAQTQLGDVTTDPGVWLGHMHGSPVASKRMPYKKKISIEKCLWQIGDLVFFLFQGHVAPSTRGGGCMRPCPPAAFVSGDIASKLDTNTRTSTDCGPGCWKTPDLHWQNPISAILHRRNRARAGGTWRRQQEGQVRGRAGVIFINHDPCYYNQENVFFFCHKRNF